MLVLAVVQFSGLVDLVGALANIAFKMILSLRGRERQSIKAWDTIYVNVVKVTQKHYQNSSQAFGHNMAALPV